MSRPVGLGKCVLLVKRDASWRWAPLKSRTTTAGERRPLHFCSLFSKSPTPTQVFFFLSLCCTPDSFWTFSPGPCSLSAELHCGAGFVSVRPLSGYSRLANRVKSCLVLWAGCIFSPRLAYLDVLNRFSPSYRAVVFTLIQSMR